LLVSRLLIVLALAAACQLGAAQSAGTPFGQSAENPSLSVVGDVAGRYGLDESHWFAGMAGVELGVQAAVDPFAKADFLLHYSTGLLEPHHHEDESAAVAADAHDHEHGAGLGVEEALITLTSLPGGLQASVGRMRSRIGLANVQHLHDFSFVAYPKIVTGYWGEEGLAVDGLRASWLAPLPVWTEIVLEGQKALDEHGPDIATGGLNLFFPFGDDFGLSLTGFAEGDRHQHEEDSAEAQFGLHGFGGGFRFKWKPAARSLYTYLLLQGELHGRTLEEQSYTGFYGMAEYKFARQWAAGLMFEQVTMPAEHQEDPSASFSSLSAAFSFWPSEFQRLRLQYDHPLTEEKHDQRLTLAWTFLIGPHKPHSY